MDGPLASGWFLAAWFIKSGTALLLKSHSGQQKNEKAFTAVTVHGFRAETISNIVQKDS